jgi:hypothetical protein
MRDTVTILSLNRAQAEERRATSEARRAALDAVGGLGKPSKMPGLSYGLPAAECITGTKLRDVPGSVCAGCYAYGRGHYGHSNVLRTQYARLDVMLADLGAWASDMTQAILASMGDWPEARRYFRWHDSGDLQSTAHLLAIFDVCEATPTVRHWLPTREYAFVRQALAQRACPPNLVIRLSAHMVDGPAPRAGLPTSTVVTQDSGRTCPAPTQGNNCGDCRACWDPLVENVAYHVH